MCVKRIYLYTCVYVPLYPPTATFKNFCNSFIFYGHNILKHREMVRPLRGTGRAHPAGGYTTSAQPFYPEPKPQTQTSKLQIRMGVAGEK